MKNSVLVAIAVISSSFAGVNGSNAFGSWDGHWSATNNVDTRECFALCYDESSSTNAYTWFVESSQSYVSDRLETNYATTGAGISLTYSEPDSGGITENTESWTYSSFYDYISGTNTWRWTATGQPTEEGTTQFTGSRTYSCEKFAAGEPQYTATWSVSQSSSEADLLAPDDPAYYTTETFRVRGSPLGHVEIVWSDNSVTDGTYDECKRRLSFTTVENEAVGGTTTTQELWELQSNGKDWVAIQSNYTYTGSGSYPASTGRNRVTIVRPSSNSLSTGAIVAIVACLVLAFGMTVALCMYCKNKSKMSSGRPKSVKYAYGSEQQLPTVQTVAPTYDNQAYPVAVTVG